MTAQRRVRENIAPRALLLAEDGGEEFELTFRERADELIRVAAPQVRDELRAAARKLFYA